MLLFFGILFLIAALVVAALIAFANGMSDSPGTSIALWPAGVLLAIAIVCFVARIWLRGHSITF